jgi:hypothetical protein
VDRIDIRYLHGNPGDGHVVTTDDRSLDRRPGDATVLTQPMSIATSKP